MQNQRTTAFNETGKDESRDSKDLLRLKAAWERLQKAQEETLRRFRKSKDVGQISSVRIVSDANGKKKLQINLVGGGKIMDMGDKKRVFQKMMPKKQANIGKILSLLDAVRMHGFAAVAMGLSPEMKALLLKVCKQCSVPLKKEKEQKRTISAYRQNSPTPSKSYNAKLNKPPFVMLGEPILVNSLHTLVEASRKQKEQNDLYLKFVLERTEERGKEAFFDRLRSELGEITLLQRNGAFLTKEQENVLKLANSFGLNADKTKETPSTQQMQNRSKLTERNLPTDIQQYIKEEKKRYKAINSSKNKAVDLLQTRYAADLEKGANLNFSSERLAIESAALLPPPEERTVEKLNTSNLAIEEQKKMQTQELNEIKKTKRTRAENLIVQAMTAKQPKGKQEQKHPQNLQQTPEIARKTFLSNTLIQELIDERQAER